MTDLLDLAPHRAQEALEAHFRGRGQPAYRARQVLAWLYRRDVDDFAAMTDLPAAERGALAEAFAVTRLATVRVARSRDGTAKHLWKLPDGELVESVLIPAGRRVTLCVSSQAGCAMACAFCATGWMGYRRQLRAGEIVAQVRGARAWAAAHGYGPITNVVFMGMGEPLLNRSALWPSLETLHAGLGLGARRITVSTVGIVPGILEMARRPEPFRLAVSLHAPNSELRAQLMPIERKYPLPELLEALRVFDAAGKGRITFEYVLIRDVNDALPLADELAEHARSFGALVNLIPFNPIPAVAWEPSPPERIRAFAARLERRGVAVSVREPRGRDIAAACGQLRAETTAVRAPAAPLARWGVRPHPGPR
jgi:23S rRNA (adenine2503-C2)-methyltransferase